MLRFLVSFYFDFEIQVDAAKSILVCKSDYDSFKLKMREPFKIILQFPICSESYKRLILLTGGLCERHLQHIKRSVSIAQLLIL